MNAADLLPIYRAEIERVRKALTVWALLDSCSHTAPTCYRYVPESEKWTPADLDALINGLLDRETILRWNGGELRSYVEEALDRVLGPKPDDGSITLDLNGCARCEGDGHPQLTFYPLDHPLVQDGGGLLTHWATCPTNGQPILQGWVKTGG